MNYDSYDVLIEEGFTAIIAFVVVANTLVTYLYEELITCIFRRKNKSKVPSDDKVHPDITDPS